MAGFRNDVIAFLLGVYVYGNGDNLITLLLQVTSGNRKSYYCLIDRTGDNGLIHVDINLINLVLMTK